MRIFLTATLSGVLFAGCIGTPAKKTSQIEIGMSEAQVIGVLGKPASRGGNKDGATLLFYNLRDYGSGAYGIGISPYTVTLQNGKVAAYGRDTH